jgi:hypothetical protein
MRRLLLSVVLLLLASAAPVAAQTTVTRGPLPATARFIWNAPTNVTTVAQAQTFEPRLYRGSTPLTALTSVTCQAAASTIECTAPVSASNLDALNQVGQHSVTLSLFRADVGEGPHSDPFVLTTPAGAPTAFRIIN